MKASDLTNAILILLIFVGLYLFNILAVGIKNIQDNWPLYRCNPMVMPFANTFGYDTSENFTYCIQNMQTAYMGSLLEPINYNLGVMADSGNILGSGLNDVRAMFSNIRDFITDIVSSVFGVFLNIIIEFQKIIINIKDLFAKFMGILATIMYVLSGSIDTMQSAWAAPPGQLVRALCFHPDTILDVCGKDVKMRDIQLGTPLKYNSHVCAVMQINNMDKNNNYIEDLYEINTNKQTILVSGSHLIYDRKSDDFIHVKDYHDAKLSEHKTEWFSCLITSNHTIPIDNLIFHDWEDNNGSPAKKL